MLLSRLRPRLGFVLLLSSSIRKIPVHSAAAAAAFVPATRHHSGVAFPNPSASAATLFLSSLQPQSRQSSTGTTTSRRMMTTTISFDGPPGDIASTMLVGEKEVLEQLDVSTVLGPDLVVEQDMVHFLLESIDGPSGAASTLLPNTNNNKLYTKLIMATIPAKVSRNNHPWSVHSITELVANHLSSSKKGKSSRVVFVGDTAASYKGALVSAVAKAFPVYSRKTGSKDKDDTNDDRSIHVSFADSKGKAAPSNDEAADKAALAVVEGVQLAARLMDMYPEELTTDAYAAECRSITDRLEGVTMTEIVGEELNAKGYGGIYGVGKAATCPPRLVIMEYTPSKTSPDTKTIALVGKGIVYDTGGLSLKTKMGMCGMKHDMGGSAGMLGGFVSAVQSGGCQHKVTLLLCLAENAIGPTAFRNDDILTMYSGKTVEVNNCDAEGRLVLGDGVAHASKHIANLDLIVDMATLTGAQLVCTGRKHAGILATTPELEQRAVKAGLASGDLTFPMLYAPEMLKKEFASKVADMKNSVKDRSNAQSSCAGHFIEAHLDEDYKGEWLHVDMAGPGSKGERGTGYGVGLVLSLLDIPGFS